MRTNNPERFKKRILIGLAPALVHCSRRLAGFVKTARGPTTNLPGQTASDHRTSGFMSCRARASSAVFAIVCIALVSWAIVPREPRYKGKALSEWLRGYLDPDVTGQARDLYWKEADEAVRQAGAAGIPTLIRLLETPKQMQRLELRAYGLAHSLHVLSDARFMKLTVADPWTAKKWGACRAFEILGPTAAGAVPRLATIYAHHLDAFLRGDTGYDPFSDYEIDCLRSIGPAAKAALPSLVRALNTTNMTPAGIRMRYNAGYALVGIHAEPQLAIPALIQLLEREPASMNGFDPRLSAAEALGAYGPTAKAAIPVLTKMLKDANVRMVATNSLLRIGLEAANGMGSSGNNRNRATVETPE